MELNRVLARAFASIVVSIDLSDDDAIDPDVATDILEPASALLDDLSEQDRRAFADMLVELAELEENPERRRAMADLPDVLGLLDEEED
ncbi:hypothetical protein QMZ92_34905 [Streptomyces sp. HNM0645]|uniref:hypothetical protein n=1 Tax=Streptomyces sp. HNM0645 TaxID=2782343 RepID=UPI0024B86032|nr:hypothetical protein [Streptomyces sp. HNM0645]MDI9889366.1 hypothetical protein [Streptomyces sp. HNM0645]